MTVQKWPDAPVSVESRASWVVAVAVLAIMSFAFGAPLVAVVGLKSLASDLGSTRSAAALGYSLAWLGAATGGVVMGPIAERVGVRWTAMGGAVMIGLGLILSSRGGAWQLWIGHGVFIGLFGIAAMNAPFYVYVTRWFDRRRGTALALIASGQYIAGVLWPLIFQEVIVRVGWQRAMEDFALLEVAVVLPIAAIFLKPPPRLDPASGGHRTIDRQRMVLGLRSATAFALISIAAFLCCVPMAMPQAHLVAFCGDLGIPPTSGAGMLSLALAAAFVSRQIWGAISDRVGGLRTVLAASACQALSMVAFLATRSEVGLFAASAFFGLGFSGLIPAYVLAVRELFPASEAAWRIPIFFLFGASGMAAGGWLAGAIYDHAGYYAPAFAAGIAFNLANLAIVGLLVLRDRGPRRRPAFA
ncbi:MAG TPA: MFS transporter [Stellaceae bacterium]|nr:MFS transporter [Stellaceae bacterium]